MLDENWILKLNKDILKRYEHNLEGGILFLYNVKTDVIWKGNASSNDLIELIDGKKNLNEIYSQLETIFEGYSHNELKESFDSIIDDLLSKNFLEVV